jgi:hypothetical protein
MLSSVRPHQDVRITRGQFGTNAAPQYGIFWLYNRELRISGSQVTYAADIAAQY